MPPEHITRQEFDTVVNNMTNISNAMNAFMDMYAEKMSAISGNIQNEKNAPTRDVPQANTRSPVGVTAASDPEVLASTNSSVSVAESIARLRGKGGRSANGDAADRIMLRIPSIENDVAKELPVEYDKVTNKKYIARKDYDTLDSDERAVVDSWRPVNQHVIRIPAEDRERAAGMGAGCDFLSGEEVVAKSRMAYKDVPDDWKKENQIEARVPYYENEKAEGLSLTYNKADQRSFVPKSVVSKYDDAQRAQFDKYNEKNQRELHVAYHDYSEHFEENDDWKFGFDGKNKVVYLMNDLTEAERRPFEPWNREPIELRVPYADSERPLGGSGRRSDSVAEENGVSYDPMTGKSWIHEHDIDDDNRGMIENWRASNQTELRIPYDDRWEGQGKDKVDNFAHLHLGWDKEKNLNFIKPDKIVDAGDDFINKYDVNKQHDLNVPSGQVKSAIEEGAHWDKERKVVYLTGDQDPTEFDHLVKKSSRINGGQRMELDGDDGPNSAPRPARKSKIPRSFDSRTQDMHTV